jgi:type IV secretion system protein VirD4
VSRKADGSGTAKGAFMLNRNDLYDGFCQFLKKRRESLSRAGITIAVLLLSTGIVTMFINLLINYLFLLIKALPAIIKGKTQLNLQFHLCYIFNSSKHIPGLFVFAISMFIMTFYGRKIVLRITQKIYSKLPLAKPTVEGRQRWATNKEINKLLKSIDRADSEPQYAGIVLASDKNHIFVEYKNIHTFVIGTTGAGKSQTIVLPSIHTIIICKMPESMVINDVKGELFENTYYDLINSGYEYYVLDFHEPARSSQWNPLSPIINSYVKAADNGRKDFSKAIELANELAAIITDNPKSDPVWPQSAKSLLVAMIIYLTEDGYKRKCLDRLNLYSIYNFFLELGGKEIKIGMRTINALDQLMSTLPIGHPAKMAYATSKFAVGEMRSSIFATLASNLQIFADSGIAYMTGGNDIDFRKLVNPDKPCAIYMVLPENKPTRYMLSTMFISQCYSALVDIAEEYPHRILPQRVHFILDELGISPRIPDLENKTSAARSMNIVFDLFVQSMTQLEDKYGKGAAATIQNNCGNWVYLNSLDPNTNKYVSQMLGNETLQYSTYNAENGDILEKTKMDHFKSKPLMKPEELPQMQEGEIVVIRQRSFPIHSTLTPFYKLGLPAADIKEILPLKTIDLDTLLYPVGSILVPGIPNLSQPDNPDEEEKREKLKVQGVINNMNIFTQMQFSQVLSRHDYDAAWQMINKNVEEQHITEDQLNILDTYITGLQEKEGNE